MRRFVWLVALLACGKQPEERPAPRELVMPADAAAPAVATHGAAIPDAGPPDARPSDGKAAEPLEAAPARRLWAPKLDTEAEFLAYSKEIGGERFAKFVIDVKSDAIYYFDVDVYKVHKDFIFQELYRKPRTKAATRIFDRNYGKTKTDFLMCYLIHHLNQDVWTFAFWDGDLATAKHVQRAYRRMKETFFNGDKVKFRPDSNYQEEIGRAHV